MKILCANIWIYEPVHIIATSKPAFVWLYKYGIVPCLYISESPAASCKNSSITYVFQLMPWGMSKQSDNYQTNNCA